MVRCITATFVLSGVLLAGLCYVLYTPFPPHLANQWQLQLVNAKRKAVFLYADLQHRLGFRDRLAALRDAISYNFQTPLTEEDKAQLEIYDTHLNGVFVRVYKPKSAQGLLPGLVIYHGGAWAVMNVPSYDGISAHLARKANIIVISVEYRLAPENPFPAAFNDCLQAALYALLKGEDLGLDTSRIAIGGDSAGGNLAAAVNLKLRDDKVRPAPKAQLVIYGVLQLCDLTLPSHTMLISYDPARQKLLASFAGEYLNFTDTQKNLIATNKYLTPEMQRKCDKYVDYKLLPQNIHPEKHVRPDRLAATLTDDVKEVNSYIGNNHVFPLMTEDLSNLPPSFLLAAEWDMLRDENLIFAERMKMAGNKVKAIFMDDSFHGIINSFEYERYGLDAGPVIMKHIISFLNEELNG